MSDNVEIYQSADGSINLPATPGEESVCLNQAHICELFGKNKPTILLSFAP
ncbi:hypothetical protein [Shewanella algae]|uniref:hypothetical protein n=1 Tax=Shewanella algae TaxID=38313 RepID=UPI001C59C913|nr:hypothetical protein [Shewanella algae]HDS1213193.1 hypothetical protein [Shewanella algae]